MGSDCLSSEAVLGCSLEPGLEVRGLWLRRHPQPRPFRLPVLQLHTGLSRPRKHPLQMHPLPQINQVRYSLLHGSRRPGQRRPRGTPTPPAAGPAPSTLQAGRCVISPGPLLGARRSDPCAPSSVAIWDRRRPLHQPPGDAGARGGAQARAVTRVPSELGARGGRSCCKLWGAPFLSGASRSRRPAPDIAWEQGE